ncbi:MAG: class I adenylate-forming enzyme family protein [Luminiphilus sp.]|nr:class I adenylate-forming enzyme family protein [Luminiphilus sp.]
MSNQVMDHYRSAVAMVTAPGAFLEVTTIEADGQALKAYQHAPRSMRDLWLLGQGFADQEYIVYGEERWTFSEAGQIVANFASWLQSQGIGSGDRVAIALRNYPEWIFAYWGVIAVGGVVVGMNAWWVADEMAYALNDSEPKLLVADDRRLAVFADIAADFEGLRVVAVRESSPPVAATQWEEAVRVPADLPMPDIQTNDDACIFYTSGTTGRPKGAQLTHRGCVHNIMNVAAMGQIFATTQAMNRGEPVEAPISAPAATSLVATPLFHVTANNCVMHGATISGGKLVLMYKWDTEEALKLIEREKVNTLSAVPMMTRELLAHPDFAEYDTSSLNSLGGGGAAMHPDLPSKVVETTQRAKPAQGYGMTEVCGISTYTTGDLFLARPQSCGPLVPTLEGKIVNKAGDVLPVGEAGELLVKGAPVIKGYLNRPEATAETIVDGWLHTGDIGYFDEDGFLYLVDRVKDMILRGGENIYCAEVEGALYTHPAVLETVAFAVPDDRLGEEVGVAVHLIEGAIMDAPGLREHMGSRLAAFKVPRYVWFLSEPLPRNANGKFLKRELREVLDPGSAD